MSQNLYELADGYFSVLRDGTQIEEIPGGWAQITTPFLDCHNDRIQIHVRPHLVPTVEGEWFLTDDGQALGDWDEADISASGAWLEEVLRAYCIERAPEGSSLYTTANEETFGERLHALLSVVLVLSNGLRAR